MSAAEELWQDLRDIIGVSFEQHEPIFQSEYAPVPAISLQVPYAIDEQGQSKVAAQIDSDEECNFGLNQIECEKGTLQVASQLPPAFDKVPFIVNQASYMITKQCQSVHLAVQTQQPLVVDNVCCLVCSGPSEGHLYYGALVCHRCRVFFKRTVDKKCRFKCKKGAGKCR